MVKRVESKRTIKRRNGEGIKVLVPKVRIAAPDTIGRVLNNPIANLIHKYNPVMNEEQSRKFAQSIATDVGRLGGVITGQRGFDYEKYVPTGPGSGVVRGRGSGVKGRM